MEIAVLLVLLIVIVLVFKSFDSLVYFICVSDIFLRLINYISSHVGISELKAFVIKYFPTSLVNIITKYSSGVLTTVLIWALVAVYCVFVVLVVKNFLRKK